MLQDFVVGTRLPVMYEAKVNCINTWHSAMVFTNENKKAVENSTAIYLSDYESTIEFITEFDRIDHSVNIVGKLLAISSKIETNSAPSSV